MKLGKSILALRRHEKNLTIVIYPEILRQLSTGEVQILKFMRDNKGILDITPGRKVAVECSEEQIANLKRLGIIEEELSLSGYANPES